MTRIASSISRRRLLQTAIVTAGALRAPAIVTRAFAQAASPPPDPDFSKVTSKFVGVRPHRKTGVRLQMHNGTLSTTSGPKYLIHNYGHSGAGITLSWGCASFVAEYVAMIIKDMSTTTTAPSVAVLGTGVIGLTVATELRGRWPQLPITIYSKDDVTRTTSYIAGGQFEPSFIHNEYEQNGNAAALVCYLNRSIDKINAIKGAGQQAAFGIADRVNYTLKDGSAGFNFCTNHGVPIPFTSGPLPFDNLKADGRAYQTWLIDPTILLPKLIADLGNTGTQFRQKIFDLGQNPITSVAENIIINCTGLSGPVLANDDPQPMIPRRGHLVGLQKTDPGQDYFYSGGCANDSTIIAYVFCRTNDIVVGGSAQDGNSSTTPGPNDDPVFQHILERDEIIWRRCQPLRSNDLLNATINGAVLRSARPLARRSEAFTRLGAIRPATPPRAPSRPQS